MNATTFFNLRNLMKTTALAMLAAALPVFAQPRPQAGQAPGAPGAPQRLAAPTPPRPVAPGMLGQRLGAPGMMRPQAGPAGRSMLDKGILMAHEQGKPGREWKGFHKGMKGHGKGMPGQGKAHIASQILLTPMAKQRLNLNDDQVNRIRELDFNSLRQRIQFEAQVKTAELDLRQSMEQDNPDRNKVLSQVDAVSKAKADLAKLDVTQGLDLHAILTPEQREKIKQFHAEVAMRGQRGWGGREGFGRGPEQWQKLREQREERMRDLRDRLGDRARDRGPRDQGDRARDRGPRDQGAPGGRPQNQPPQPPNPPAQPGGPQQNPL